MEKDSYSNDFPLRSSNYKTFEIIALVFNILFSIAVIPLVIFEIYALIWLMVSQLPILDNILILTEFLLKYIGFIFQWAIMFRYHGSIPISNKLKTIYSYILGAFILIYLIFTVVVIILVDDEEILRTSRFFEPYVIALYLYLFSAISTLLFVIFAPSQNFFPISKIKNFRELNEIDL